MARQRCRGEAPEAPVRDPEPAQLQVPKPPQPVSSAAPALSHFSLIATAVARRADRSREGAFP